jgi:hypothetical protein
MDALHYAYALTYANSPPPDLGAGVDPRYGVELLASGRIAAAASVVGLDEFDLAKIQEGSADVAWLGRVALRHNAIVQRLAALGPVLPLRLATLFRGKPSLMEKLARCEADVAAFLDSLGDRLEWAVKVYLDRPLAERTLLAECSTAAARLGESLRDSQAWLPEQTSQIEPRSPTPPVSERPAHADAGRRYLAARRQQRSRAAQLQTAVGRELSMVEDRLGQVSPKWRRLRPLSAELTARPESMVWNAALLVAKDQEPPLRATCERLRSDLGPKGLLVELTGPWPVYHFCEQVGIGT